MATNDFLTFSAASGANVVTQSAWVGLSTLRAQGFQSGVAQSAQVNKAIRQASIISSIVAQYVADTVGQDVLDDGTTATILGNLKSAIRAQSSPVGSSRGLTCPNGGANTSLTYSAVEIVVETALGGQVYRLANFLKTINATTVGAGGMDTGVAPVTGYVAIYAIYNPATSTSALLGVDSTTTIAPEIYGGANMPAGYTASCLIGVWPTNASRQFTIGLQVDRVMCIAPVQVLNNSTIVGGQAALSLATAVPKNARYVTGTVAMSVTGTASQLSMQVLPANLQIGNQGFAALVNPNNFTSATYGRHPINQSQQIYYSSSSTAGSPNFQLAVSGYEI